MQDSQKLVEKDFNLSKKKQKTFSVILYEVVFGILSIIVIVGSVLMYFKLEEFILPIKEKKPKYKFPDPRDLNQSLVYFVLFIILYKIVKSVFEPKIKGWLEENYTDPDNVDMYCEKVAIYFLKCSYLFLFTIVGHYVLKDLDFFPKLLLGNGDYRNILLEGENMFYFEKTKYFDLFYMVNLAWALFDTYLLFTLPLQSDFPTMLLHHLTTISLVIFSYLGNFSSIGCVVFYLHYSGDAVGYIIRISVYIKVSYSVKLSAGISTILMFFYTRIIVFGSVIYDTYYFSQISWGIIEYFLFIFMIFLYILHMIWLPLIIKKIWHYSFYSEIEELYKMKKR